MIIIPLGIASATPTATRHLPSIALWREGSISLFDCGENTQMRMLQAGLKRSKVDYIFISHFDIDHYSGLIGLLSTLQLQRREKPLTIVGPEGIREYVEWNFRFAGIELTFEIRYVELEPDFEGGRVIDEEEFFVEARPLKHNKFCAGFRFQEKDKPGKVDADLARQKGITEDWQYKALKAGEDVELEDGTLVRSSDIVGHPRPGDSFAYITDTSYSPNAVKLAMNTNILVHEATFSENLADKAAETGHCTSIDAARVANEAQTKLLVITHFSARYTNPFVLLREVRREFFPAWLATELRPIYTDPAHEKGIITPKVYLKEIDARAADTGKGPRKHDKQKRFRKRRDTGGNVNFRPRRRNDSDRMDHRVRRSDSDRMERVRRNDRRDDTRKPRHITPRTPFDDFDRF